jgi:hypothetical protein
VHSGGALIQGNMIGTNASATIASGLGNGRAGIVASSGTHDWQVGGTPNEGNTIAGNGGDGVSVLLGTNNAVLGNSIHSNTGLGIDLNPDGVTQNDLTGGDGDGGPNGHQNFPEITAVTVCHKRRTGVARRDQLQRRDPRDDDDRAEG